MPTIKKCKCGHQTTSFELRNTTLCPQCKSPVILVSPSEEGQKLELEDVSFLLEKDKIWLE